MKHDEWKSCPFSSWSENDFKRCVEDGITVKEIADWWKLDVSTIYKKFKKYGIKPVSPYPGIKAKRRASATICKRCGKTFYKSKFTDNCLCNNCGILSEKQNIYSPKTPKNEAYYDKLIELRESGWSYKAIAKELGINKSIISYICNPKLEKPLKRKLNVIRPSINLVIILQNVYLISLVERNVNILDW